MNLNKLKKILQDNESSDIFDVISAEIELEELKEIEQSIGFVDDAIKNLDRSLQDNKSDLAGWLSAIESGDGVQPRLIDIKAKPVVIKSIEVQLEGMKELKEELESTLSEKSPKPETEH